MLVQLASEWEHEVLCWTEKNNSWCYFNLLTVLIAYVYLKYFEQHLIVFKNIFTYQICLSIYDG